MVFHKGKMYRMGNGNIPPFTKEIMLLIRSVREMFRTCAEAIVKTTAYIVGYRNTAMSKAPTRIRPQLWTTVGSNHVQTYQLEMHMSLSGHPLKMIRPMVMKWSTRKDYIQYVLYCLYVDNHRVCAHVLVWSCMMSHEDDTIFNTSYLYPQASCMWFVVGSTHKWNFLAQDILARSKLKNSSKKKTFHPYKLWICIILQKKKNMWCKIWINNIRLAYQVCYGLLQYGWESTSVPPGSFIFF